MTKLIIWCILVILLKAVRDRSQWGWNLTWLCEISWLNWWKNLPTPWNLWHMIDGLIIFTPVAYFAITSGIHWLWLIVIWIGMYPLLMVFIYHYWFVKR